MTDMNAVKGWPGLPGGLPGQRELMTQRAIFTEAYALIPRGVMRDIVTSFMPHWHKASFWVLARPLSGFAETFSQYLCKLESGGGSEIPDTDPLAQSVIYLSEGCLRLTLDGQDYHLEAGGYAFIPAGSSWQVHNNSEQNAGFHWIRKAYQAVEGIDSPPAFVCNQKEIAAISMVDTQGAWKTTRFVDPSDLRYDFHVNIVSFEPGGTIPFEETHVMEHGLFVLEGKAVYKLNNNWHEVEAGDFMWLRAFCPQACYAAGPEPFRYLLYKDVNRHMPMQLGR